MTAELGLPSVPAPLATLSAPRATTREDMCAYYREIVDVVATGVWLLYCERPKKKPNTPQTHAQLGA
jgi:hypothetical protein